MARFVYDALTAILGGSLIMDTKEFLTDVLVGVEILTADGNISSLFNVLCALAGALMTLFFFADMISKMTADMLTLERIVIALIKLFVGFAILICLQDITKNLIDFGLRLYDLVGEHANISVENDVLRYFPDDGNAANPYTWPAYSDVKEAFEEQFGKNKVSIIIHFALFFALLLPYAITLIAKLAAFFMAASNAVTLTVRLIFCPLQIAQCFEDGMRSPAIKALKRLAADAFTFAVILGVLYAASILQANMAAGILDTSTLAVGDVSGLAKGNLLAFCAVNLAAVGAIFKANQIANEVMGN